MLPKEFVGDWHVCKVVPVRVAVVDDDDLNILSINVGLLTFGEAFCSYQHFDVFQDEECSVAAWNHFYWPGVVHCLLGKVFIWEDSF